MDEGLEQAIELTRRDQGNLAESLVVGLNEDPPEFLNQYVSHHAETHYSEYIGDRSVRVHLSDLNEYTWTQSEEVDVTPDLSWRPDLIAEARMNLHRGDREWKLAATRLDNPNAEDPPVVDSEKWGLMLRVLYPMEVKSGEKVTLTEQQAEAIPEVAENSRHVHPLVAEVDITDLPESFDVKIRDFNNSSFSDGSRY